MNLFRRSRTAAAVQLSARDMKSLGDGMWAPIACAEIDEKFQPMFESVGKPITMAVFVRREEGMRPAKEPRSCLLPFRTLSNCSAH